MKNSRVKAQKIQDGPEPKFVGEISRMEMISAYSWYSQKYNHSDSVKFLKNHLQKTDPKVLKKIRSVEDWRISQTIGWIARIMDMGATPPKESINFFNKKIKEIINRAENSNIKQSTTKKPVVTLYILGEIDLIEDEFIYNDYKSEFVFYDWFKNSGYKISDLDSVYNKYSKIYKELENPNKEKDYEEGFSHLKTRQKTRYKKFVKSIIDDVDRLRENKRISKKPRKATPKKASKQVEKLNYMPECGEFKLVSIAPEKIIGAKCLWVFNTRYRKLIRYESEDGGFTCSGTTLGGVNHAVGKTIRKPNEFLPEFLVSPKIKSRKLFDNVRAKETPAKNRINPQTILLKVYK